MMKTSFSLRCDWNASFLLETYHS